MTSTKKRNELTNSLDDLRSQDPKKRLVALGDLKQIATSLGPLKTRGQLLPFLSGNSKYDVEYLDDEESIVLELLQQLSDFSACLGGVEYEKTLLPLLISFCRTDERKQSLKSCSLIAKILETNKDMALDTIKKLIKTEMKITKECAASLISAQLHLFDSIQPSLLQLYAELMRSSQTTHKIVGSKYLQPLLKNAKNKEEIGKMLDSIFNQSQELTKMHSLKALIDYYEVNSNMCLTKFKNLSVSNSWRVNMKICEHAQQISQKISKAHFKLIFEPMFLKFLGSAEPELKASACAALVFLSKNLTEDQLKTKLVPCIKKLSQDPCEFVKIELSKNIISICPNTTMEVINEHILPVIFAFIKETTNYQISLGIMKSFQYLSTKVPKETLEEKIIKPLTLQFNTDNWRLKCQILEVLKNIIHNPAYLSESILKIIFSLTDDKIDAVRLKVNQLIINIVNKQSKQWSDQHIISRLQNMKDSSSYIKRQNLLDIIEKTVNSVSEKTLKEVYQNAVVALLADKVPNVRYKTLAIAKSLPQKHLISTVIDKHLDKLKQDKDSEVREVAKKLRA